MYWYTTLFAKKKKKPTQCHKYRLRKMAVNRRIVEWHIICTD